MTSIPEGRIGDYVIDGELGGSAELVYTATHVMLPRRARIAVAASAADGLAVMKRACIVEALRHPAVPRIYECGLLGDRRPWVAAELLDGPTLAELAPLAVRDAILMLRDLAAALEYAHGRGVAHGALRPEVVVQTADGIRLAGWGGGGDPAGDLEQLGEVVYFALTRTLPARPVARRCPGAPARLTALLDRMLATQAAVRPSAAEIRVEAGLLADRAEPAVAEDDGIPIEVDEVVLVDISRDPPPVPRASKPKWTPEVAYVPAPAPASQVRKKTP